VKTAILKNAFYTVGQGAVATILRKQEGGGPKKFGKHWTTSLRPGFDSRQRKASSLLHGLQTGSEAHSASYPMGTGSMKLPLGAGTGIRGLNGGLVEAF
jgi:hypothetical protein